MHAIGRFCFAVVAVATCFAQSGAALAQACEPPPTPVRDIAVERFYGDAAGSKVDPELQRRHEAAVAPLTAFVRRVTQDADKALRRSSPKAQAEPAGCALGWLTTWAKGGAWLGIMSSKQAEYQRKWDLAGVALAYLKLQRFATAEQRNAIEPWLIRFADAARAYFDNPTHARNNHWYWLGLAVAAVAETTGSARHWDMAREIMHDAARDIAADGTLAKELARDARALHYHVFAVQPLVVMAELAAARGEDWYALNGGALHRLVATTQSGLVDVTTFDRRAGIAQERPVNARGGWLQLYAARVPEWNPATIVASRSGERWIGGDAMILRDVLARQRR